MTWVQEDIEHILNNNTLETMRSAIKDIQRHVGITTVYVTHDQEEALAVSDRIAVMKDGIIQQVGNPVSIYSRPSNVFVASFNGQPNLFKS